MHSSTSYFGGAAVVNPEGLGASSAPFAVLSGTEAATRPRAVGQGSSSGGSTGGGSSVFQLRE